VNPYEHRPWLAHYAEGVPHEIEEPTQTLADMIDDAVARFGRRTALEFFGAETSYRELGSQIARTAEGLRRLGVGAGDRVALVLPNCPQHVAAFYAVLRLGAIVVEHNPLYTPPELRHQFEDHEAKVAIVWDAVADTVADFPRDIRPAHLIAVDLTRALPFGKRMALRLPIRKARASRAAPTSAVVRDSVPERPEASSGVSAGTGTGAGSSSSASRPAVSAVSTIPFPQRRRTVCQTHPARVRSSPASGGATPLNAS